MNQANQADDVDLEVEVEAEAEAKDNDEDKPSKPWTVEYRTNINEDQKKKILQIAFNLKKEKIGGHLKSTDFQYFAAHMRADLRDEFGVSFWCLVEPRFSKSQFIKGIGYAGVINCACGLGFELHDDNVNLICYESK